MFHKDKELVFTAFTNDSYFKAIAKLKSHEINYTIKNKMVNSRTANPVLFHDQQGPVHYEIYVNKKDVQKASQVINQN